MSLLDFKTKNVGILGHPLVTVLSTSSMWHQMDTEQQTLIVGGLGWTGAVSHCRGGCAWVERRTGREMGSGAVMLPTERLFSISVLV